MATCKSSSQTGRDSWQSRKSLSKCLRHSLENRMFSDVTFKVGREQKSVQAHRLIVSIRSGVFEAMFYGPLAEQDEIIIPEVEHDIFEQFLRYLYTDKVTMDGASVMGLLYVSKKYDVKTLEQKCLAYLSSSITTDNACVILEQAHVFDEQELKEKALTFILENGDAALKSSGVIEVCQECLVKIIQAEELVADEQSVFGAVVAWSESACRKQNKVVTHENRRQVLGEATKHVRFPLLDQKYFVKNVPPTNLLTDTEKFKILAHWVSPDESVLPFNANKRIGIIRQEKIIIQRLTLVYFSSNAYPCTSAVDHGIMFSVNQDASLLGFQLYGPKSRTTANYDIRAFITDPTTDDVIEGSSVTKSVSVAAGTTTYDVEFPRPLKLSKDKKYNLIVNVDGPDSHWGKSGRSTVQNGSFVCSFFNCQKSKHSKKPNMCTDVTGGQIPGLMFLV
ncbi:BTB/POZ domain-containing protein 6-like [Gigantopelta aegis]|uniref:BTB/POZ domain-containing protein 6-like n=1 Tax=Gigantopelta aegis TaxID=1735272 RepID=UPI001B88936F|nr:BTB/POZ domain-containing protein 6-like [Gigantopelta aegis]XP_041379267.1 BTB/POZ domain-containing protein 6-like [Gigantopelta aegis]XP_041379269.1 BTB/POZ domain-containing protein 6-like [Gigantopelta aegis]